MVQSIQSPNPRQLLPPLLATLPTAFFSSYPPPALLPLLSPTLSQRIQYLTTADTASTNSSTQSSWLPLLNRSPAPGAKSLVSIVSDRSEAFEFHPVSGEIDYGEIEEVRYRRLDEETLHARIGLPSLALVVVYLWCQGEVEDGGPGWRVAEVKPLELDEEEDDLMAWSNSIAEADKRIAARRHPPSRSLANIYGPADGIPTISHADSDDNSDDDADYWAQYDNTPSGRTPALSPGAKAPPLPSQLSRARSTSEAEYYAQYANIQPEMDNDDPSSEDRNTVGASTLNGNVLASVLGRESHAAGNVTQDMMNDQHTPNRLHAVNDQHALNGLHAMKDQHQYASQPQPNGLMVTADNGVVENGISQPSAAHSSPPSIERLQDSAELQSVAETAIKQHASASLKSLFRLCRSTGMDVGEFDEMVRTELETLKMMDGDD